MSTFRNRRTGSIERAAIVAAEYIDDGITWLVTVLPVSQPLTITFGGRLEPVAGPLIWITSDDWELLT